MEEEGLLRFRDRDAADTESSAEFSITPKKSPDDVNNWTIFLWVSTKVDGAFRLVAIGGAMGHG